MSFDSEFANRRALELMDEIESETQPRSRQLALCGVWHRGRKYVESIMYVRLFDCTTRGVSLDEIILDELQPYCNVPVRPSAQPRLTVRQPAAERHHNGEVSFAGDCAVDTSIPIRAEAIDLDYNDADFPNAF